MGIFCILVVFERYLSNAWTEPHQILGTMSADVPLPPLGSIGPWGVEEELKTQKMKGGLIRAVEGTISIFLSASKCGSICRAQNCAHSGVEPSRSAKAILQGGPKVRQNFEFFTISRFTSIYLRNDYN